MIMKKERYNKRNIQISNFGALGDITFQLDGSLQVIIGPQASGKSTLAKAIYFCRKIKDYLSDYAFEIWSGRMTEEPYPNFLKYLRKPFMGCFGTTKHMDRFVIKYFYDENNGKYVKITLRKDRYVLFKFSENLKKEIQNLIREVMEVDKETDGSFSASYIAQRSFLDLFKKKTSELFEDDEELLYIPAGRNMLATIPDIIQPENPGAGNLLQNVDISQIDLVTQDFIRYIQQMRGQFGVRLDEIKQHYLKTVSGSIRYEDVDLACALIREILKADYVYDKDGEKLYYAGGKWTKLMFGSSGQQEVLWALNCLFLAILQKKKSFIVFEEPESHLFPDSQEKLARLVALLLNSTGSEAFITTHSPYMLTSFNLLLYSGRVEEKNSREPVVDRHYRLRPEEIGAYYIPGERKELISLTEEGPLIDAERIDRVSEGINQKMDQLLAREVRRGEE